LSLNPKGKQHDATAVKPPVPFFFLLFETKLEWNYLFLGAEAVLLANLFEGIFHQIHRSVE